MELVKEPLQEKIASNIQSFDLSALLKLLAGLGYAQEDIYFEGNNAQISHKSLCHEIRFEDHKPRVRIVLNLGLLSASSSLPSFFQKFIETEDVNTDQFIRYLDFFNHHLIDLFLQMTMPEINARLFTNWKQSQFYYLSLLGFESISTLWFLMKICFPDLVVEVKKDPQVMKLYTSSLILGRDGLGMHSFLGTRFKQTLSSFKITFSTEDEMSELGVSWPIEINKRLIELIFPILKKTDLHLSIVLKMKKKGNYMTLGRKTYLGFDRLWKSNKPFQLLLFYGLTKNLQRNVFLSR